MKRKETARTAIILAGGLGTRLRPALANKPKVLAPAAGKPFLHYLLSYLESQGIQNVVLALGYLAELVEEYIHDEPPWKVNISTSIEREPLGTAGAVRAAVKAYSLSRDLPVFVVNGDTLFLIDLDELASVHQNQQAGATIALLQTANGQERGCVRLDDTGLIRSFSEKPDQKGTTLVNGGIYIFQPAILEDAAEDQFCSLEKEIFPTLASQGKLAGNLQQAYFMDIGTPESLHAFEVDILQGRFA